MEPQPQPQPQDGDAAADSDASSDIDLASLAPLGRKGQQEWLEESDSVSDSWAKAIRYTARQFACVHPLVGAADARRGSEAHMGRCFA